MKEKKEERVKKEIKEKKEKEKPTEKPANPNRPPGPKNPMVPIRVKKAPEPVKDPVVALPGPATMMLPVLGKAALAMVGY